MKINEVTNEAPVGAISQIANKFGSKALNKIGAKDKAYNLAGKADLGDTANRFFRLFNNYIGTQNKSLNQATGSDVVDFLKLRNIPQEIIPSLNNGVMQKNQINDVFLQLAKDGLKLKQQRQQGQPSSQKKDIDGDGKPDETDNTKIINSVLPSDLKKSLEGLTTEQRAELLRLL